MSINNLPTGILEHIFSYLDNQSMQDAISVCKLWEQIIGNSSKFMKKFKFQLPSSTNCQEIVKFPKIPLKNIRIKHIKDPLHAEFIADAFKDYKSTIESLEFSHLHADNKMLTNIFNSIDNLKELSFNCAIINLNTSGTGDDDKNFRFNLPNLRSLSIYTNFCVNACRWQAMKEDPAEKILSYFWNNQTIETFSIQFYGGHAYYFNTRIFCAFLNSLKNLKHLILLSCNKSLIEFPFSLGLQKLEIDSLYYFDGHIELLLYLKDSLKELRLVQTTYNPRNYKKEKPLIKFIIDKLNLENFYVEDIPIILNGKIQDAAVKDFIVNE
ncbi:hypothetical protein PVAND_000413 [Polypedilum vanderplanki]|uniref:F-box domain-containing protein n=1 Tax=Polypedilum vanderplanki TaxID=319348 RepID=A0A9J6BKV5_POLVA|nr:hypothetical protein PVAND_000413 [Polypedilum vanderplanki]